LRRRALLRAQGVPPVEPNRYTPLSNPDSYPTPA
jgi:hypothetical protein